MLKYLDTFIAALISALAALLANNLFISAIFFVICFALIMIIKWIMNLSSHH